MNALYSSYTEVNGQAFLQLSWPTTKMQHDLPSQSKQNSCVVKLTRKIQISLWKPQPLLLQAVYKKPYTCSYMCRLTRVPFISRPAVRAELQIAGWQPFRDGQSQLCLDQSTGCPGPNLPLFVMVIFTAEDRAS